MDYGLKRRYEQFVESDFFKEQLRINDSLNSRLDFQVLFPFRADDPEASYFHSFPTDYPRFIKLISGVSSLDSSGLLKADAYNKIAFRAESVLDVPSNSPVGRGQVLNALRLRAGDRARRINPDKEIHLTDRESRVVTLNGLSLEEALARECANRDVLYNVNGTYGEYRGNNSVLKFFSKLLNNEPWYHNPKLVEAVFGREKGILVEMFDGSNIHSGENYLDLKEGDPVAVLACSRLRGFSISDLEEEVFVGEVEECDGNSFTAKDAYIRLCGIDGKPLTVKLDEGGSKVYFREGHPFGSSALDKINERRYKIFGVKPRKDFEGFSTDDTVDATTWYNKLNTF